MALGLDIPSAILTQRFGPAVSNVYYLEPAGWAQGDRFFWSKFPGSSYFEHFHPAIDQGAPEGTPVVARESGIVVFAGWASDLSGYAVQVEIKPGTLYGGNHYSKILVKPGQRVVRDVTVLALVGHTGRGVTGSHEHSYVQIWERGSDGIWRTMIYDPTSFLSGHPRANDPRIVPVGAPTPPPPTPVPGPIPNFPARVNFAKGTYIGHRFASNGAIVASKPYTLVRASSAPASMRSQIVAQHGWWVYITGGVWSGYWIQEGPGISYG